MRIQTLTGIAAAVVLGLGLGACGQDEESTTDGGPATQVATETVTTSAAPDDRASDPEGGAGAAEPPSDEPSTDDTSSEDTDAPGTSDASGSAEGSDVPRASHPAQPRQSHHGDKKFHFRYFDAEVLEPEEDPEHIEGLSGVYVRTCLHTLPEEFKQRGTVPVSAAAWHQLPIPEGEEYDQVVKGGYQPAYPGKKELAVGECAEGFVSARQTTTEIDGLLVEYRNSLGAHGSWSFD